ncbi:male-specific protein scotti [Drosophila obscura]|uniref:male-specific protein scotti n=1 Tax=Drosophila obscura TaxID=7282 RepID=UPI000B9FE4CF|nr:male-specific protein scotti [Drosophila obscura]
MDRIYQLIRLPSIRQNIDDHNQQGMELLRRRHPQLAMLLDAPNEPPRHLEPLPAPAPPMPRKKRSFLTTSQPFRIQTNVSELQRNAWQALQDVPPEQRRDRYVKYMLEHMNSQNYPNGEGLPHRWGQF